jgi:hypothetical protein
MVLGPGTLFAAKELILLPECFFVALVLFLCLLRVFILFISRVVFYSRWLGVWVLSLFGFVIIVHLVLFVSLNKISHFKKKKPMTDFFVQTHLFILKMQCKMQCK